MAGSRRLLVLDDDPTGSQCVAGIDVAFDLDPAIPAEVLTEPGSTCFVLTNTRALDEADAVSLNRRLVAGVLADPVAREGLHVVSRSDSTLRGHVIAEPVAIADELAAHDVAVDAILLVPAMLEAGRYTEGDVHYAVVDGVPRRVEDTDFARDATFGYTRSDLREFLEERSGGAVRAADVLSIGLDDIRTGGVGRVHEILAAARDRRWVVVNATEYSDMEVVAEAVSRLEAEGRTLITRCGPSFVRPLAGQSGAQVVDSASITIPAGRLDHGLVVVGSHVGLTTTQLRAVQERGTLVEVELHVPSLLDDRREQHLGELVEKLRESLQHDDCVLYTSRDLVRTDDPAESLAIARSVSDAVVEVVRRVRSVKPAWVLAKGGITSHEVAANGLGIRRARVEGQFWPGQVSLFSAQEAPDEVMGAPYVVFPGNVGGEQALADVVDRLTAAVAARRRAARVLEPRSVEPVVTRKVPRGWNLSRRGTVVTASPLRRSSHVAPGPIARRIRPVVVPSVPAHATARTRFTRRRSPIPGEAHDLPVRSAHPVGRRDPSGTDLADDRVDRPGRDGRADGAHRRRRRVPRARLRPEPRCP